MDIVQIGVIGIVAVILSITIKKQVPQFSIIISIITGVLIFLAIIPKLQAVIKIILDIINSSGIDDKYIAIILKVIGIAYIAQFCSQICADAGENSIALKIELGGKILIMICSAPILIGLFNLVMVLLP